jgi:preprotein translocase subunit YajC
VENVILLLIIGIPILALYFLVLRPAQNRARAVQRVADSLAPGQRVMTTSGLFGTLVGVEADVVRLEISGGVVVEFARRAIARVIESDEPDTEGNSDT